MKNINVYFKKFSLCCVGELLIRAQWTQHKYLTFPIQCHVNITSNVDKYKVMKPQGCEEFRVCVIFGMFGALPSRRGKNQNDKKEEESSSLIIFKIRPRGVLACDFF